MQTAVKGSVKASVKVGFCVDRVSLFLSGWSSQVRVEPLLEGRGKWCAPGGHLQYRR